MFEISGNIVDAVNREIYSGTLKISCGKIIDIIRDDTVYEDFILPGFVDSHIHIESSMLTPSEFARMASVHGTVAAVSDPHEIANILGVDGVMYMIDDAKKVPLKFYFGAPSCVPATTFETSGAILGAEQIEKLLKMDEVKCLAEMMNFSGVINRDPLVMKKIELAGKYSKPVDGHTPGLTGETLKEYAGAGITTDHECFTEVEALEKIGLGMKILIREGSVAKNFDELVSLVDKYPDECMFCSDDKHPDDLVKGHVNNLVKRALDKGIDLMKILRVACVNPVLHYKLDVGLLRIGDNADFVVVDNLSDFNILKTVINGEIVAEDGKTLIEKVTSEIVNNFKTGKKNIEDFRLPCRNGKINVVVAEDGQLITNRVLVEPKVVDGNVVSDVEKDVLKIVVVNRYREAKPAIGFVKNFGLRKGAIASSVAHDSHNVIAVGANDQDIHRAVNLVIGSKGGICTVCGDDEKILPLYVAGIMSDMSCEEVAEKYEELDKIAKSLGSRLHAPFMTLSFMALPVIPKLKLTDRGLFDSEKFKFVDVFEN